EKLVTYVMNSNTSFMVNSVIAALTAVCSFIETVMPFANVPSGEFPQFKNDFIKNYRLHIEMDNDNNFKGSVWFKKKVQKNTWTVHLWYELLLVVHNCNLTFLLHFLGV